MLTILLPCSEYILTSSWQDHLNRAGYKRQYAGTDLAGVEQPLRPSQYNGKVLQAMWSDSGYGYTTFTDYSNTIRIRTAHQKDLNVKVGDIINPNIALGIMGSTGNSTGTHVHWEVWVNVNNVWQNIDPYNTAYGIKIVNNVNDLVPIGEEVKPTEPFSLPTIPKLVKIRPTISSWINLRSLPSTKSLDIGDVCAGELWECFGYSTDYVGNIWFAIKKGTTIGWAAAYYNGEQWLEEVTE